MLSIIAGALMTATRTDAPKGRPVPAPAPKPVRRGRT